MSVSTRTRFQVFHRDGFTCRYCGHAAPNVVLQVDHVTPRCAGGRDTMDNLVTACVACNAGKSGVPLPPHEREVLFPEPACIAEVDVECRGGPLDGERIGAMRDRVCHWVFRAADGSLLHTWDYLCVARDGHYYLGRGAVQLRRARPEITGAALLGFYVLSDAFLAGPRAFHWHTPDDFILRYLGAL